MTRRNASTDARTPAAQALASLDALVEALQLDDALLPREVKALRASNRVPTEAMKIAVAILQKDPKKFPHFDAGRAQAAIDFEAAMLPVADELLLASKRIRKAVFKRRSAMANETLALYQMAKGAARLTQDEEMRGLLRTLKDLLTTNRRAPREERVTAAETKVFVRAKRKALVAAKVQQRAAKAGKDLEIVNAQAAVDAMKRRG